MFSSMTSQKPITYFFSHPVTSASVSKSNTVSSKDDNASQKKLDVINEQSTQIRETCDDPDSPFKQIHKKKIRCISSDEENDDQPSDSKVERDSLEIEKGKRKKRVRIPSSESEPSESGTPKKTLRTYGKSEPLVIASYHEAGESVFEDDHTTDDKDLDKKHTGKSDVSKTLKDFFGNSQKSSSTQPTNQSASTESCAVSPDNEMPRKSPSPKTKSLSTKPGTEKGAYNPSKSKYHPVNDAPWKKGERVPYLALAKTLEAIENVSARLTIIEILANFLRSVIALTPEDLLPCIYLCLNKLAPDYEGLELGVGDMVLMKAISQSTGQSIDSIKNKLAAKGDLGIIAEASRLNQRTMFSPPPLTVKGVYSKLREIAQMTGQASMSKKVEKILSMIVACRQCESRFLIRSLSGKLRIGLAEQSVLTALAQAVTLTPPNKDDFDGSKKTISEVQRNKVGENTLILKTTYCECPNYDVIIPVLLKEGIESLPAHCKITPGVPITPMLAHPTKGIQEVLQRFEDARFTCEYKYDGERAQIHRTDKEEIYIYSRNQENNTTKYPDVISRNSKSLEPSVETFIVDSEIVAWDTQNKQLLPFQILSTRKRKDVSESDVKVQVCVFAFDLLYLNGRSLVKDNFEVRRQLLHEHFKEVPGVFQFVQSKDFTNVDDMAEFLDEAVKNKCEGLMIKTLDKDATYEIAKRSHNWLKLKKDYLEGVGDTLDLVVIGGYHGKGKRTGTYGGFLLACYDEDNEEFQTICKIGTGFKDEDLTQHSAFLKKHVIPKPKPYYRFDSSQEPDEWLDAVQVWEVKCADLSISPTHQAAVGIVDPEKGVSLRFPRFMRIRDDKRPEDATSANQVAKLYWNQEQVKNVDKTKKGDDEDSFY